MTQYTESYSSASSEIQNIVANDISLLENYILMQTGDNEWTALINTMGIDKTRKIVISRSSGTGYNNRYFVEKTDVDTFEYQVNNEYYVYSNLGLGRSLSLPIHESMISYSMTFIACMLMFVVIFKGWAFKCLKQKR